MRRLTWSPRAIADLARLRGFLAKENPAAAKRAIRKIRRGARLLTMTPDIGMMVWDDLPQYREWFIGFGRGAYVVFYRIDPDEVALLTIRHSRELGL